MSFPPEERPIPDNEAERLENLKSYGLDGDYKKDPELQDIARLAAELCGTSMGLVNIITKDMQLTKASYGIADSLQLERCDSVCQYTITQEDRLEIESLSDDKRFQDLWYVKDDPQLQFYSGVPLTSPEGYNLGSLCVLDPKPKRLTDKQVENLNTLARTVINRFQLLKQNKELEDLTQDYRDLIQVLSHDIRSPLHGIIGLTDLLKDGDGNLETERRITMLSAVQQSAQQLLLYSNELLETSLSNEFNLEANFNPTEIATATKSMINVYQAYAVTKNVSLNFNNQAGLSTIHLDEDKYRQVLGNLISNAIKFTKSGGQVDVILSITEEHKRYTRPAAQLIVKDTGIGIKEKHLEMLFNQTPKIRRRGTAGEQSTGIGLPLIKRFVDLHEGEIHVDSSPDSGTEFTVILPDHPPEK